MRLTWTRAAIADLREAREYVAVDNPGAASALAVSLLETAQSLVGASALGRRGLVRNTRDLVVPRTPYRLIYRVVGQRVEVLRVMHQRRAWPPHAQDTGAAREAAARPVPARRPRGK